MPKHTYVGIICPRLLHKYTWVGEPETEEQAYELTFDDFNEMSPLLNGKPMRSQHGNVPVGKIVRNWEEDGAWKVEFELEDDSLAGHDMVSQVNGKLINSLSLKHHRIDREPYEVSLVYEPGRPGSDILRDPSKNGDQYKVPTPGVLPVGLRRDAVIAAAKGSMSHVHFHDGKSAQDQAPAFTVVQGGAGGASSSGLDALRMAEELIQREQQKAVEARKAIELAKQREMRAQQHLKMDSESTGGAPSSAPPAAAPAPQQPQMPSTGSQMQMQVDSQVNAQGGSLSMPVEEGEPTHALPIGQQIQKQIERQIPGGNPLIAAGATSEFAEFLAHKAAKAAAAKSAAAAVGGVPKDVAMQPETAAAPPVQPEKLTGDPAIDAVLQNPNIPLADRKRLLESMERRVAEEAKLKAASEAAHTKAEQADQMIKDYRENYIQTDMAFKKMMLERNGGKFDEQAFNQFAQQTRAGQLDGFITSPAGQQHIAAAKGALQLAKKTTRAEEQMSAELLNRARALGQSMGGGAAPGVAHSFSATSFGEPRFAAPPVLAASRPPAGPSYGAPAGGYGSGFTFPSSSMSTDDDDEGHKGMGLGIPAELQKPAPVVAAAKTSFGHASGSQYNRDPLAPWNTRLQAHYHAKALSALDAQALYVPGQLPKNHPVVISASKGGLGAAPSRTASDAKGGDQSWMPGLTAEYFHPDTLAMVIGDGRDVPHDFELLPEDEHGGSGVDLGGVMPGTTSSRKKRKT